VPGNLDDLRGRAVTVHLDVAPRVAAQRLGGGADRPLLSGDDSVPVETRLDKLLVLRGPFYRRASAALEVSDRSAAEVADLLVEVARTQAGWQ
jgi:shikimate kinase